MEIPHNPAPAESEPHSIMPPDSRRSLGNRALSGLRAMRDDAIHQFGLITGISTIGNIYNYINDPNAMSGLSSAMNMYDFVLFVSDHHTERLDQEAGSESSEIAIASRQHASRIREAMAKIHVGVAGAGMANALYASSELSHPTTSSIASSLGMAALGGGAAYIQHRRNAHTEELSLSQRFGKRLIMTKFWESASIFGGLAPQYFTDSAWSTRAGATVTFLSVWKYMHDQVKDERQFRKLT